MSNQIKLSYYLILNHYSKILKCPFSYFLMLTNLKTIKYNWTNENILSERKIKFLKIEGLDLNVWSTLLPRCQKPMCPHCGHEVLSSMGLCVTPGGLSGWQKQERQTLHTGPRTPRHHSPSPSSICALSWSCVFLCSFYVSLLEEPRVSDEHLKHRCNQRMNYSGK